MCIGFLNQILCRVANIKEAPCHTERNSEWSIFEALWALLVLDVNHLGHVMSSGHFVLTVDQCCVVSSEWPLWIQCCVNSQVYVMELLQPFTAQLAEEKREYAFFQQDGATTHTLWFSMSCVHETFGEECMGNSN